MVATRLAAAATQHWMPLIKILHDSAIAVLSLPVALILLVGFDGLQAFDRTLMYGVPAFAVVATACFIAFRLYRGLWRFTALADLLAIVGSAASAVLVFAFLLQFVGEVKPVPPSALLLQFLCLIILLGGSRCLGRLYRERVIGDRWAKARANGNNRIPILLAGGIEGVDLIIRAFHLQSQDTPYRVVGIVDLADGNVGRQILNVPILGTIDRLREILSSLERKGQRPQRIVLTTQVQGRLLRDLQHIAEQAKTRLCRLPKPTEFQEARGAPTGPLDLLPIAIEDLLSRPQVKLDDQAIDGLIEKRRVLVTGAGGSIGSELCRQIARHGPAQLILIDNCEYNLYSIDMTMGTQFRHVPRVTALVDIRDAETLDRVFREHRPDLVFNAAALKHVPLVEMNPIEGVLTNVFGTRNVAEATLCCGALAFVQVSTDKAVAPTNVMGATKRLAEYYCQALDLAAAPQRSAGRSTMFKTVRFGNVIGSSGSVVPLFQQQVSQGGPVTVTHPDITRYLMTIREAAELVLQALAGGIKLPQHRGEIYVLDMGSPVRILDIAKQMIRLAGQEDVPIEIVGLRPGEKLHEELFDSREKQVPSGIPGVLMAHSKPMSMPMLENAFQVLLLACRAGDKAATIRLLAQHVPGYTPPVHVFADTQPTHRAALAKGSGLEVVNGDLSPKRQPQKHDPEHLTAAMALSR